MALQQPSSRCLWTSPHTGQLPAPVFLRLGAFSGLWSPHCCHNCKLEELRDQTPGTALIQWLMEVGVQLAKLSLTLRLGHSDSCARNRIQLPPWDWVLVATVLADLMSFSSLLAAFPFLFPFLSLLLLFSSPPNKSLTLESLSLGLLLGKPELRHLLTIHLISLGFSSSVLLVVGDSYLFAHLCIWDFLLLCLFRLRSLP